MVLRKSSRFYKEQIDGRIAVAQMGNVGVQKLLDKMKVKWR